eukprot:g5351.t1
MSFPPAPPESPGVVRRRRAVIVDAKVDDDDDPGEALFLQESWRSFTNMAILPLLARSAGDERRRLLSIYARWEQVVKECQRRALRTRLLQFRAQYRIFLVYQQYCDYRIKVMYNFVETQIEELVFRSLSRAWRQSSTADESTSSSDSDAANANYLQSWAASVIQKMLMYCRLLIFDDAEEKRQEEERRWQEYKDAIEPSAIRMQRMYRFYKKMRSDKRAAALARAEQKILGREVRRDRLRALERLEEKRVRIARWSVAAVIIQSWWRRLYFTGLYMKLIWRREQAAIIIQSIYRSKLAQDDAQRERERVQREKDRKKNAMHDRSSAGAASAAYHRVMNSYEEHLDGSGKFAKGLHKMKALAAGGSALLFALGRERRADASEIWRKWKLRNLRPRSWLDENSRNVRHDELKRGDIVRVRWRGGDCLYDAQILAIHYCCFVSRFTSQFVGDEERTFTVRYLDDGTMEQHVRFSDVEFLKRLSKSPPALVEGS